MIKICKHCGREFETNNPQKIYCDGVHYRPCPVCGSDVAMLNNDFSYPPKCCSTKCSVILRRSKYKDKICIECGETFRPNNVSQVICNRLHYRKCEVCGKKFEVTRRDIHDNITTCSMECRKILTKRRNLIKYGVEHPMQCNEVQTNFHKAMKEKYGVEHALQIPSKVTQQQKSAYQTNMKNHGVPYACLTPQCMNASHTVISKTNKSFSDLLNRYNISHSQEYVIDRKSFDFYLPDHHTVIEINPSYTHSIIENHFHVKVNSNYHLDKSRLAKEHGLRCIHIFDWDDWTKIVLQFTPKVKIYARDCKIEVISQDTANTFLSNYHLQGTCKGQEICLGLYYNDALVQVMTFGRPRYNKKYEWELLRLCTCTEYNVIGGVSKLFKHAVNSFNLNNIISYCDLSKFNGDVYEKIDMRHIRDTKPNKIWSKNRRKITDNLLRQRGYDQLFNTSFGKGTSNDELMIKDNWLPVYDCGQCVFEYRKEI